MEQVLDPDQLVARVVSVSYIAALAADEQAAVADEVSQIASRYGNPVVLRYVTRTYCTQATVRA